jgi:hypothetical protein
VPGGNFASLVSYGDVTAGAIGTTSYVCGDDALAFGHPMQLSGRAHYGANDADALAIVRDSTFGAFKMANIGPSFGTVDQDRLAALRGDLTTTPELIPVVSTVTSIDLGRTRAGRSFVTSSVFVPGIAPGHLFANIDGVIDRVGGGTAMLELSLLGHRPDGSPWQLHRRERVASQGDISFEAAIALEELLSELDRNRWEDVAFDQVAVRADVSDTFTALEIRDLRVSVNGSPFQRAEELAVSPGDELVVRVTMRRYRGPQAFARVTIRVPGNASGFGMLDVSGGGTAPSPCDVDTSACPRSFPGLVKALRKAPRNDQIVASLVLLNDDGSISNRSVRSPRDSVVVGGIQIPVVIVR